MSSRRFAIRVFAFLSELFPGVLAGFFFVFIAGTTTVRAQTDITQPGDPIVGTSANTPLSGVVSNAIDNQPTVYLNLDKLNTGFTVTPLVGSTLVTGLTLQAAGDAPERDPASYILCGSNDGSAFTEISRGTIPLFPSRGSVQKLTFANTLSFNAYRLIFPTVANAAIANSMHIAEVELLGVLSPQDVTRPGDPITASSDNSPVSSGAANAIDNQPPEYRNFDKLDAGFTVTPSMGASVVVGLSMKSAADAPERDPASYVLFGATNGATFTQIAAGDIPPFAGRSTIEQIQFENSEKYTSYKLIFPTVRDAATADSMQIAEVELLGFGANSGAIPQFKTEPADVQVLVDAPAHFKVVVNGPWQIQWHRNGVPIAGATELTYDTPPVDAGNNGDAYFAVARNGALTTRSDTAHVYIFTPSSTPSIGINFRGAGPNGAPTDLDATDIAGVWPQAYWNNAAGDNGALSGDTLLDSDNSPSPLFIDWQTPGSWSGGVGVDTPDAKLLNGYLDPQNGSGAIVTFSNLGPGKYRIISYALNRPGAFNDADYSVTGATTAVARIRPQNADEYNLTPGFIRGANTNPDTRPVGNHVQFEDISPAGDGTIVFSAQSFSEAGETPPGGAPVNGIQLIINPPLLPVITAGPEGTNVTVGDTLSLNVIATGTPPFEYEWRRNGARLFDGGDISGASTSALTIRNVVVSDAGNYSVKVTNAAGSVSANAAVTVYDPVKLTIAISGETVTLTWRQSDFVLQGSDSAGGTYAAVPNVTGNSHTVNASSGTQFFRLFQP
jgi:hypothetical protein